MTTEKRDLSRNMNNGAPEPTRDEVVSIFKRAGFARWMHEGPNDSLMANIDDGTWDILTPETVIKDWAIIPPSDNTPELSPVERVVHGAVEDYYYYVNWVRVIILNEDLVEHTNAEHIKDNLERPEYQRLFEIMRERPNGHHKIVLGNFLLGFGGHQ